MSKPLRILVALLACTAFTTSPAVAEPVTGEAIFEQALVNIPPLPVQGTVDLEETADGMKVVGVFQKGFVSGSAEDYKIVVMDDKGKVVLEVSKEWQEVAEIEPPAVAEFEFSVKSKKKLADIYNEDMVVYQVVNVAGLKLLAEIGRAKVAKG